MQDSVPPSCKHRHGLGVAAELGDRLEGAHARNSFMNDVLEKDDVELGEVIEAGPELGDQGCGCNDESRDCPWMSPKTSGKLIRLFQML